MAALAAAEVKAAVVAPVVVAPVEVACSAVAGQVVACSGEVDPAVVDPAAAWNEVAVGSAQAWTVAAMAVDLAAGFLTKAPQVVSSARALRWALTVAEA